MKLEMVKIQAFDLRQLYSELLEFKLKMNSHVIDVLTPFLTFSSSYIDAKAHNMLVVMLDLCFKNIKIIQDYVNNIVASVVVEYDVKVVYLLLL
jgi:hypothetical protein